MTAIGFLIVGDAGPTWLPVTQIGWSGLWLAAILTLVTGWDYLRAGMAHMLDSDPASARRSGVAARPVGPNR
jgi:cardiolipin synthase